MTFKKKTLLSIQDPCFSPQSSHDMDTVNEVGVYLKGLVLKNNVHMQISENPRFVQSEYTSKSWQTIRDLFSTLHPESCKRAIHPYSATSATVASPSQKRSQSLSEHLLSAILAHLDPNTTLMSPDMMQRELLRFKGELAGNLDNDKQLYKKFGFSRKRGFMTIDDMKKEIQNGSTLSIDTITYLGKLVKSNFIAYNTIQHERIDIDDSCEEAVLIVDGYVQYGEDGCMVQNRRAANRCVWNMYAAATNVSKEVVVAAKVIDLKRFAKIGGENSKLPKDGLVKAMLLLITDCGEA